jgi:hypothetical protein
MKTFASACVLSIVMLLLGACGRESTDRPEIKSEIELMRNQGWDFVEMVGEAHSTPVMREIRHSDASGSLTVHAGNTGVDGYGDRSQSFDKTFKKDGFDFLEVKIMTSPADGYCLVFQKPRGTINNSASTPQKKN